MNLRQCHRLSFSNYRRTGFPNVPEPLGCWERGRWASVPFRNPPAWTWWHWWWLGWSTHCNADDGYFKFDLQVIEIPNTRFQVWGKWNNGTCNTRIVAKTWEWLGTVRARWRSPPEELSGTSLQHKTFRRTFRQIPAAENFQKNFQVDPCSRKEQKYFSPTMFKAWKCSWKWFDQHRRLIHHICSTGRNVEFIFGPHKSA